LNPAQLTKRIEELSAKLKPVASEGIRIDISSFTEPEQLVLLKNVELDEKYRSGWTREAILENKEMIVKCNMIAIARVNELFLFTMPRAFVLDEVEQWFFKFNFSLFWARWIKCQNNVRKWSEKDREDFLRDIKVEPKADKKHKREVEMDGEENDN
jgi:hypothetical protein